MRLSDAPPIPKYWQLAETIKQQIEMGSLHPGDRLPSLSEMLNTQGLSRTTVEKAHSLLEQEGLLVRRQGAGVFVAAGKKRLPQGTIGLAGLGFSFNGYSSYWAQVLGGVREATSRAGVALLVLDPEPYPVSTRGWEKVDGLLACDWGDSSRLRHAPPTLPCVSLMTPVKNVASVFADDYAGSVLATQHLLELGHHRIGFLHAWAEQALVSQRLAGYADALNAAGIEFLDAWEYKIQGAFQTGAQIVGAARRTMTQWLSNGWCETGCTALLCQNDETALGAIQALQAAGLQVPHDVSVVGFDGTEFCDIVSPRLSSVEVPLREISMRAVELLLRQIETDSVSDEHQMLPVRWNARESTALPRTPLDL